MANSSVVGSDIGWAPVTYNNITRRNTLSTGAALLAAFRALRDLGVEPDHAARGVAPARPGVPVEGGENDGVPPGEARAAAPAGFGASGRLGDPFGLERRKAERAPLGVDELRHAREQRVELRIRGQELAGNAGDEERVAPTRVDRRRVESFGGRKVALDRRDVRAVGVPRRRADIKLAEWFDLFLPRRQQRPEIRVRGVLQGEHEREGEAEEQQGDDDGVEPLGEAERLLEQRRHLREQPSDDGVKAGNPDDVPALQFGQYLAALPMSARQFTMRFRFPKPHRADAAYGLAAGRRVAGRRR